jgi:hypothetical protein
MSKNPINASPVLIFEGTQVNMKGFAFLCYFVQAASQKLSG